MSDPDLLARELAGIGAEQGNDIPFDISINTHTDDKERCFLLGEVFNAAPTLPVMRSSQSGSERGDGQQLFGVVTRSGVTGSKAARFTLSTSPDPDLYSRWMRSQVESHTYWQAFYEMMYEAEA